MWGEVTPAERLRAVTRRSLDDDRLAVRSRRRARRLRVRTRVARGRVPAGARPSPRARAAVVGVRARSSPRADAGPGRARQPSASSKAIAPATGSAPRCRLLDEGEVVAAIGWPDGRRRRADRTVRPRRGRDPGRRCRSRHPRCAAAAATTRCASSTRGIRRSPTSSGCSSRRWRSVPTVRSSPRARPTRSTTVGRRSEDVARRRRGPGAPRPAVRRDARRVVPVDDVERESRSSVSTGSPAPAGSNARPKPRPGSTARSCPSCCGRSDRDGSGFFSYDSTSMIVVLRAARRRESSGRGTRAGRRT